MIFREKQYVFYVINVIKTSSILPFKKKKIVLILKKVNTSIVFLNCKLNNKKLIHH
jgi:hypothetical protein